MVENNSTDESLMDRINKAAAKNESPNQDSWTCPLCGKEGIHKKGVGSHIRGHNFSVKPEYYDNPKQFLVDFNAYQEILEKGRLYDRDMETQRKHLKQEMKRRSDALKQQQRQREKQAKAYISKLKKDFMTKEEELKANASGKSTYYVIALISGLLIGGTTAYAVSCRA